jgi:hypothetical protein
VRVPGRSARRRRPRCGRPSRLRTSPRDLRRPRATPSSARRRSPPRRWTTRTRGPRGSGAERRRRPADRRSSRPRGRRAGRVASRVTARPTLLQVDGLARTRHEASRARRRRLAGAVVIHDDPFRVRKGIRLPGRFEEPRAEEERVDRPLRRELADLRRVAGEVEAEPLPYDEIGEVSDSRGVRSGRGGSSGPRRRSAATRRARRLSARARGRPAARRRGSRSSRRDPRRSDRRAGGR